MKTNTMNLILCNPAFWLLTISLIGVGVHAVAYSRTRRDEV